MKLRHHRKQQLMKSQSLTAKYRNQTPLGVYDFAQDLSTCSLSHQFGEVIFSQLGPKQPLILVASQIYANCF